MNASISGFGFLPGYVLIVGVASFLEKFSMKQIEPVSGELSHGDWDGGYRSRCTVAQTRKSQCANKRFTFGCAYRPLDGGGIDLLCALTGEATSRDGHSNLYQLRPGGAVPLMAVPQ